MNVGQSLIEALGTLTTNKLRSGLTILGIVIGVAAVISMLAVGRGAQNSITNSINSIGTNLLFVTSGNFTQRIQNPKPLTMADVTALENTTNAPDIAAVAPVVSRDFTVAAGAQTENVQVSGVTRPWNSCWMRSSPTAAAAFRPSSMSA